MGDGSVLFGTEPFLVFGTKKGVRKGNGQHRGENVSNE